MPGQIRGRLLAAVAVGSVLCWGSIGCQAQFSFLGGPLPPIKPAKKADPGDMGMERPTGPGVAPEKEATSYVSPTADLGETPNLLRMSYASPPRADGSTGLMPRISPEPVSLEAQVPAGEGGGGIDLMQASYEGPAKTESVPAKLPATSPEPAPLETAASLGPPTSACPSSAPTEGPAAPPMGPGDRPIPTELAKVSHPPYMIEPPDILLIDAIRLIPLPPYTVQPLDALFIQVPGTPPNQPINGVFTVSPDGSVNLGFSYGTVRVAGMTLEAVQEVLRRHLSRSLTNPQVSVALTQFRGMQQLRGEHLVRQDGTISLGSYGSVYVTGMTIDQAKATIEHYLSQFLLEPQISLDVFAYNSKVYYIIIDGGGFGQQVYRLPITGNETVLDAVSNIYGLPAVASRKHIWVARPAPAHHACVQILPVDWLAIVEGGSTATNYQLFPGDRIYVRADCLIHLDNTIAKIVSPIERLFGVTLLGETTVRSFRRNNFNNTSGAVFIP